MPSIENTFSLPPFPAFPSVSRYVALGSVEETLTRIARSIEAREAISLIMGPPGTGKSLICQMIHQRYQASHEVVVLGDTPIEDRSALLRHLLHHLGADHVAGPDNDLHLALVDRVCCDETKPGGLLIVMDEAQSMQPEVLEAVRMTTNIMRQGQPRVAAIVCGGVKLEEILINPAMEAFTQRVATRCYLHPMSAEETRDYVISVIGQCGANPDNTITREAISAIHHGCDGVPRLINQLMTQAIDVAEDSGQELIDESIVNRAWATLQQLPSPMVEEPVISGVSPLDNEPTVEFGELSSGLTIDVQDTPQEASCDSAACTEKSCEVASDSFDTGIAIEVNSASWVSEYSEESVSPLGNQNEAEAPQATQLSAKAIAQIPPTAPPATALFGDFEFEEELSLAPLTAKKTKHPLTVPQQLTSQMMTRPDSLPDLEQASECESSFCQSSSCSGEKQDLPVAEVGESDSYDLGSFAEWEPTTAPEPVASENLVVDPVASDIAPEAKPVDLEAMLHQEIIGLSTYDETAVVLPEYEVASDSVIMEEPAGFAAMPSSPEAYQLDEEYQSQIDPSVNVERLLEEELEPAIIELASVVDLPLTEFAAMSGEESAGNEDEILEGNQGNTEESLEIEVDLNGPALRFVAEAATRSQETTFQSQPAHDDSDMLVYDEELGLQNEQAGLSYESDEDEEGEPSIAIDFSSMLNRMRTGT